MAASPPLTSQERAINWPFAVPTTEGQLVPRGKHRDESTSGMRCRFRSASRERGAAAVEFALVLLPLCLILLGIIEFGWIFNQQLGLSNAARETVRYMVVHPGTSVDQARAFVDNPNNHLVSPDIAALLDSPNTEIVPPEPEPCTTAGQVIEITYKTPIPWVAGFALAPASVKLPANGAMTCAG